MANANDNNKNRGGQQPDLRVIETMLAELTTRQDKMMSSLSAQMAKLGTSELDTRRQSLAIRLKELEALKKTSARNQEMTKIHRQIAAIDMERLDAEERASELARATDERQLINAEKNLSFQQRATAAADMRKQIQDEISSIEARQAQATTAYEKDKLTAILTAQKRRLALYEEEEQKSKDALEIAKRIKAEFSDGSASGDRKAKISTKQVDRNAKDAERDENASKLALLEASGQGDSDDAKQLREAISRLTKEIAGLDSEIETLNSSKSIEEITEEIRASNEQKKQEKANKEQLKKPKKPGKGASEEEQKAYEDDLAAYHDYKDAKDEETELEQAEQREKGLQDAMKNIGSAITDAMASFSKAIDDNISSMYQHQASIMARLQGSDESYRKLALNVSRVVSISPLVKQTDVIAKIKELVDTGVAYNVDMRAFLATVSENIATTFDAFDKSLLKIVRIQQADTTAARLGMEASLTKLFNSYFKDTSYLTDAFDSVSEAILEASSLMSRNASMEFEYIVQKWLGALYSVGISDQTVQLIAKGLNYLGTGNVEGITSDETTNTLFAMAASRVEGMSYAELLTGGLTAEKTNALLKSMVEYLQSIATNTESNYVTKASMSNVFGVSMADLRALTNLTTEDVTTIQNNTMTYDKMYQETESQMNELWKRVHISQMIENLTDNATTMASAVIGGNGAIYGLWKVLNIIEGLTGGIALPFLNVMGFGIDLNTTVMQLAKLGVGGLSMMGSLLASIFSGGGNIGNLSSWAQGENWEVNKRGSIMSSLSSGAQSGFSESSDASDAMGTGNSSADDVKTTTMEDGTKSGEEDSEITNKNSNEEADELQKQQEEIHDAVLDIEEAIGPKAALPISDGITLLYSLLATQLPLLNKPIVDLLDKDRVFLTFGGSSGAGGQEDIHETVKNVKTNVDTIVDLLALDRVFITPEQPTYLFGQKTNYSDILDAIDDVKTAINKKTISVNVEVSQPTPGTSKVEIQSLDAVVNALADIHSVLHADRIFKTDLSGVEELLALDRLFLSNITTIESIQIPNVDKDGNLIVAPPPSPIVPDVDINKDETSNDIVNKEGDTSNTEQAILNTLNLGDRFNEVYKDLTTELQDELISQAFTNFSSIYNELYNSNTNDYDKEVGDITYNQVTEAVKQLQSQTVSTVENALDDVFVGKFMAEFGKLLNGGDSEDEGLVNELVAKLLEGIANNGGLNVRVTDFASDPSSPLYVADSWR